MEPPASLNDERVTEKPAPDTVVNGTGANIFKALPRDILECIARFLAPNEVACTMRLICRAAAAHLRRFRTVTLSQPSPQHGFAACWAVSGALRHLTFRQRLEFLCLTAASGSLANLELAVEVSGCILRAEVLEAAAAAGQLPACQWMYARGWPWGNTFAAAAQAGHRDLCGWCLEQGCPWDEAALLAAARGGQPGLVEWLLGLRPCRGHELDVGGLLAAAAEGCGLPALQLLYRTLALPPVAPPRPPTRLTARQASLLVAAAAGSLTADWQEKVEWLEELQPGAAVYCSGHAARGVTATAAACTKAAAAAGGDATDRLCWLRLRGYRLDPTAAAAAAAQTGDVACMEYLLSAENGDGNPSSGVDSGGVSGDASNGGGGRQPFAWLQAARAAANAGHLAILQALHAAGCLPFPGDDLVLIHAAASGNLPLVQWLVGLMGDGGSASAAAAAELTAATAAAAAAAAAREPPDLDSDRVLKAAARSGSLDVLVWLRERGYAWSRATLASAAAGGCEEAVEWLVERGCPVPVNGRPYLAAACNSDLATLRCLHRLGCPWGRGGPAGGCPTFSHCVAKRFPLAALRWLAGAGCPADWREAAAEVERFVWRSPEYRRELLSWLREEAEREGERVRSCTSDEGAAEDEESDGREAARPRGMDGSWALGGASGGWSSRRGVT